VQQCLLAVDNVMLT